MASRSSMQARKLLRSSDMSPRIYFEPVNSLETSRLPCFQVLEHRQHYKDHGEGRNLSVRGSHEFCNSSPSTVSLSPDQNRSPGIRQHYKNCGEGRNLSVRGSHEFCNSSPSTVSLSPDQNRSPDNTYTSPASGSCVTDDVSGLRHKLRELETVMLGPKSDIAECVSGVVCDEISMCSEDTNSWRLIMEAISRGDLKRVLVACAKAVSDNNLLMAQWCIDELRSMVSVSGEPIQRLAAYMLEGLVARLAASGSSIYKNFQSREPKNSEILSYTYLLYEVCPYFKFGYMSANGAIAEVMKDENRVHIIDFQIGQGNQWVALIQAFAARPGGSPPIRITGISDGGDLFAVGKRLSRLSEKFNVPFTFNAVSMSGCEVQVEDLDVRDGEALAVNFAFMLHHMPDESVSTENHRDQLLRMVKSLSPKVVTLVEQESNTNTAPFLPRFLETLSYYTAMFESIDVTLPRNHEERINLEQYCLARDVVNIIACEGAERIERHELLGKWKSRFAMAGFTPHPLSSIVNTTIKALLKNYSDRYRLEERDGSLYLGWMDRNLVSSCAWK